jgi:hypothetical protein
MKRDELEKRIDELRRERERLEGELEKARAEEREAVIEGKTPGSTSAGIAARVTVVDEALGELNDRLAAATASAERRQRTVRAEDALAKTAERAELARAVDDALAALAAAWPAYQDRLRRDLGPVSAANGDVGPVERGLVANRQNEVLVKALIHAGGMGLARGLGAETPIRPRHAVSLAAAEERVAESLRTELLRVRASSPQTHVAREARAELEKVEKAG